MEYVLERTIGSDNRFQHLVAKLDDFTAKIDGDDFPFFAQFNKSLALKYVVLYINAGTVIGCGAFKPFDENTVEIKRMFVEEESRGQGVAAKILEELEQWAIELGFEKSVLETGQNFKSAINLYQRTGYKQISNYGQYDGVESSRCFSKNLVSH